MTTFAFDGAADHLDIESPSTTIFDFDYDGRPRPAAPPLRQGHAPAVDRRATASTGRTTSTPTTRSGMPDEVIPLFGTPWWDKMTTSEQGRGAAAHGGLAVQPVHARRAGRADLHRRRSCRRCPNIDSQVLRRDAGDRRGPPRRGVQPLPAREARARLPAQPATSKSLLDDVDQRQPLGHDVPRHAGAHRGPRARRVRADPQHGHRSARQGAQRLRDAGRSAPRDVRPAGAARLLPAAHARPSATSARSSASTPAT